MVFMAVPLYVGRRGGRKSVSVQNKYSTSKVLLPEKRLSQRKNCTIRQRQRQIGDKNAQSVLFFHVSLLVKVLSKCRFSPVPPYFSQSASLQGFVNLLNVGKLVYEICFFFANRTFHLLLLKSFCV